MQIIVYSSVSKEITNLDDKNTSVEEVGKGSVLNTLQQKSHLHVFPEKELHGLSPNSRIHVSVSDLYIPRIGLQLIFLQQNRQTDRENI